MKKVTITTYSFAELSEKAKAKAIDQFRDINVDHNWWEYVYDDFGEICSTLGIDIDHERTYFNGFYTQGSGATFTADLEIIKLAEGVKNKAWKDYAPNIEDDNTFAPDLCPVHPLVLALIKKGTIQVRAKVKADSRYYSSDLDFEPDYSLDDSKYKNIDGEISKLEDWLKDTVKELDSLLFSLLRGEYEAQTSDEAVKDTIEANDYQFLESGKQYF